MSVRPNPLLSLSVLWLALFGCSEERAPINRVQANALDKAIFEDSEWFALQTVIDTPAQSTVTFVGDSSRELRKIEWDIQEGFLIARDTRQHIDRIEDDPILVDGAVETGVVAMYAVESHFDIRRDYNPTTGEELNIVVENETDRPWYERDHFRVDWSKNLVANEDLGLTSAYGGIELEPLNYYLQDPEDPLAPEFVQNEEGEVHYIDIVNKYFASPNVTELSSGEQVPSCFLIFGGNTPCEPAEISVRNSFLRADPERDYQPMEYTEERMNRFGYFLTWRDTFSPDYGVSTSRRLRLVNRHNLWEESHQKDDGQFVACDSADDCSGAGAFCDFTFGRAKQRAGACTIPYRGRRVKPVAYHLSKNFPEDLEPDARALADGWSRALEETIDSLRVLECEETGGSDCERERDREDATHAFVLCHNPVSDDDHEACGDEGTVAEIGDLRYNHIGWVSEVTEGPLGYGPSFTDPETGEIVSAAAYVYGADVVSYTAYARDLLALINGDLTEDTLTDNDAFAGWIRDVQSGRAQTAANREAERHVSRLDGFDAPRINAAMSFEWMDDLLDRDPSQIDKPATVTEAMERFESAKTRLIDKVEALDLGNRARARIERIKGTDIERMMVTDEMRIAAGYGPLNGEDLSDTMVEKASPLRGQSIARFREIDALRRQFQGSRNSCVLKGDFVDAGLMGLVSEINRAVQEGGVVNWYGVDYEVAQDDGRGGRIIDYAKVQEMLRHPIFNALTAHEVGHTLGLRHNFSGSFDSLNYHPRYWELRNDDNMQPRAWDPESQAEIDGRIREYQYSTVMDYGNNFIVSDAAGIGQYDRAAIKMGYGDLVEVFENVPEENKRLVAQIASLQGFGWPTGIVLLDDADAPLRSVPYTAMPSLLGGIESIQQRKDVRFTDLQEDPELFQGVPVYGPGGELYVPYRYCGDEFADYEPNCLRYDAGADEYEALTSITDTYWNYYVFTNFMRQRVSFNPDTVPETIYSRYFTKLESANLNYSLFRGILGDFGATDEFYSAVEGFGAYTTGIGAAYNLLSRVIATPDAGCHTSAENVDGDVTLVPVSGRCRTGAGNLNVDAFDGRELRTGFSLGPDYSYWFLTRSGYFQDKALALQVLTDPGNRVIGQDTLVDIRRFQVSYYTTFQRPIQQLLRGVIGEDWRSFAARFDGSGLVYPAPDEQVNGNLDGVLVNPNLSFALQLYSMVFGMAYLPRTFDYRFIDRGRLFVKGAAESVDIQLPEGVEMVEFVDESSGLTYQAPSYPDESGREGGIAAQVLMHAQALKDAGATAELNAWMANVNILRRLTYVMGFGGDDSGYL